MRIWHTGTDAKTPEQHWINAAHGDRKSLSTAFNWASTEEGYEFWRCEYRKASPMPPALKDRIAAMYVEWKLVGDE